MSTVDKPVTEPVEQPDAQDTNTKRRKQPRFPNRLAFRPDIEGLRGVAIIIGVLYHLDFPIPGGIAGMDIFFPMSGFLITTLLAIEFQKNRTAKLSETRKEKTFPKAGGGNTGRSSSGANSSRRSSKTKLKSSPGTISLTAFFGRRIRRLMPAALATIAITLIVSKLLFNEIRFSEVQSDAFWSTFWLENFHLIRQSADYFAPGLDKSPLQHFWSLAVEEQFYLFWPVTLLALAKAKFLRRFPFCGHWQSRVLTGTVIFGIPSLVFSYTYTNSNPAGAYFSTFTRAWDLLLGASIALIPFFRAGLSPTVSKAASWLGFAFLTIALVVINTSTPYPGLIALIPTLGTCLLLVAGVNAEAKTPVYHLLASKPIRWTGKVSYSLYLWHWPLIIFAAAIVPKQDFGGLPRGIVLFALSLLLAWISYELIETPFMDFKKFKAQNYDRIKKVWTGNQQASIKAAAMATAAAVTLLTIAAFARPGNTDDFAPPQAIAAYANGTALKSFERAANTNDTTNQSTAPEGSTTIDPNWQSKILKGLAQTKATPEQVKLLAKPSKLGPDHACFDIMSKADADRCTLQGRGQSKLVWPENVPKRVVLMGHSIAAQFRESIADVLPKDVTLIPWTLAGCQPDVRAEDHVILGNGLDCGAHNVAANRAIGEGIHPGMIIFGLVLDGDSMSAGKVEFAKRVKSMSRAQVMIQQAPSTPSFAECLEPDRNIEKCKVPASRGSSFLSTLAKQRSFAATYKFAPFSLTSLTCANKLCPAMIDGYPVRWDGTHLTTEMARRLEPQFAGSIAQALASAH